MQVADIFVVQVNVNKGAEFAIVSIEVAAQVRVLGDQAGKRLTDCAALNLDRPLLTGVLPQWCGYVNFDHSLITGCNWEN